jgi:glycosyltransferase involved in cell wall biosynthesis
MKKPKVYLTGGDGIGWAVDEDRKLIGRAIEGIVDLVDLQSCEIVHSAWWFSLIGLPLEQLVGKRILCHIPGEPFRYFAVPEHRRAMEIVGRWITPTSRAYRQMRSIGIETSLIPYMVDVEIFLPLKHDSPDLVALIEKWKIPTDAYLIGSFQRDTEGSDLLRPKLVKGPDVLLEILLGLQRLGMKFHLVLAGPRRHWLINKAQEAGIPFTYIGRLTEADDIDRNSLTRDVLNLLYNLIDLYIVASRSEGGPHAILEAAASGRKIISSPVGLAEDFLDPSCIFKTPPDAVDLIKKDILEDSLADTVAQHYERVYSKHRPESVTNLFLDVYKNIDSVPKLVSSRNQPAASIGAEPRNGNRAPGVLKSRSDGLTVGLWHTFFEPPYGGGNQFMLALRKALLRRGINVWENELNEDIDAFILNSIHFDVDRFLEFSRKHRLNVIHRIDGPIFLIRGFDREKDELCYRLNAQFASATVLQSAWCYQHIVEMGYKPSTPVVIHNAVDSEIFHPIGRMPFDLGRKTRLISSSWSNNPRKGGPTYKWIEEHLDWDRYEYTFVGNVSEEFSLAKHIPPVSSEELAEILRRHDIYITASQNDPCSNALIEAMACGLPALYLNDGGHPELVGYGGLPFESESEILPQLDKIVDNYQMYQRVIAISSMDEVAEKYLALIREVVQ